MLAENYKWKAVGFSVSKKDRLPRASGVYVIARVTRLHGLQIDFDRKYVGKAKNLRRRFLDHLSNTKSHNSDLLAEIEMNKNLEFWFRETDTEDNSDLEAQLIVDLDPTHNKIRFKNYLNSGEKNEQRI